MNPNTDHLWPRVQTGPTIDVVDREVRRYADMAWIPGGTFWMGSDRHYPEEAPAHRVRVAPFWIDRTPVLLPSLSPCRALRAGGGYRRESYRI